MKNRQEVLSGILAFGITAVTLLTVFSIGGFYPFGWETLAWCDMKQQLIPLFCDFKDILAGKESLFLNFSNAGGMNFYAVFFFFLASPFSFAVAFVEKADVPFLMNILVVLKLCISGFTAGFTLKRLNTSLNLGMAATLGSAYALGGYGMLFYQNIMWLDIMYLFPLVVLGIERLIRKNRPVLLTVVLSLTVIMNFYISFMVFLFVIFFFGIFACVYRKTDLKIYVNLGISGVTSLIVSAFVWVPCLLQYTKSARGSEFIEELKSAEFFAPYETTLTVLLCSGIALAGVVLALLRLRTSKKEDKPWIYAFLVTAAPLVIEPVNLMWHTGSYMSFPARYGFIPLFLAVIITAKEFCRAEIDTKPRYVLNLVSAVIISVPLIFALLFTGKNAESFSNYVSSLWNNDTAFRGLLFICGLFVTVGILIFTAIKFKWLHRNVAVVLICLTVAVQGICSAEIFIIPAKEKLNLYNYQSVIALEEKAEKEGFYRVNTTNKLTDANMTGAAGFNSLSHYTSLSDRTFMETAKAFGYSGNWMETGNWGGSILSDALLSVGYTIGLENQGYKLIENQNFLGLGIKTEGSVLKTLPKGNRLTSLGEAFSKFSGEGNPVFEYTPWSSDFCEIKKYDEGYFINNISSVGKLYYEVDVKDPQTLYFDCYSGFSNRLTEDINNAFSVSVNGKTVAQKYPTQSLNGLLKLGSFQNETVNITIEVFKTADACSFGVFGVDEKSLTEYTKNAVTLNLREKSGKIYGDAKEGNYFLSIPYKDNYKITLDGEELEYNKALSGFIAVNIPKDGQLKIEFTPKGFYMGIGISVLGLALMVLMIIYRKKERSYGELLSGIVYGIFLGGCGAAVLWVYIIPIIINLSDLRL